MMKRGISAYAIVALSLLGCTVKAMDMDPSQARAAYGLIGYGIKMYDPTCAYACQAVVTTNLYCPASDAMHSSMSHMMARHEGHGMSSDEPMTITSADGQTLTSTSSPSPDCIAQNTAYLQTAAFCIDMYCDNRTVSTAKREQYWATRLIGNNIDQPVPHMTYEQALASIESPPTQTLDSSQYLQNVTLVDADSYTENLGSLTNFARAESLHSRYSLVLIITCVGIPIFLSNVLRLLPSAVRASVYRSALYSRWIQSPVAHPGNSKGSWITTFLGQSTRGQALFMAYIVAINVILSAVGYRSATPSAWFETSASEITTYIANRAGVLSFANLPLVILFAGRNNLLLWLTNWQHSTFLKLHRCVAILCVLEACLHSAMYLQLKLVISAAALREEEQMPYWIMGIVGTLSLALLLPISIRAIRRVSYEVFLITHILLAILALVGSWYHIILRFGHQWGYETWLAIAIGFWAFERMARVVRVMQNGVKMAKVFQIDEEHLLISVEEVDASAGSIYVYFPTLQALQPWLNHPFSAVGVRRTPVVVTKQIRANRLCDNDQEATIEETDNSSEKHAQGEATTDALLYDDDEQHDGWYDDDRLSNQLVLLVRTQRGTTAKLARKADQHRALTQSRIPLQLPCLIEAGYGAAMTIRGKNGRQEIDLWHRITSQMDAFPQLICFVGGVGISAVLPALIRADEQGIPVKVFWSCRSAALVQTVRRLLTAERRGRGAASSVEMNCFIGQRFDLTQTLIGHLDSSAGSQVILSGPSSMTTEAQSVAADQVVRIGAKVLLVEECFCY